MSRPIEAFSLLNFLDKERFNNFYHFVERYGGWKGDAPRNLFAGWMTRSSAGNESKDLGPKTLTKVNRLTELFETGKGNSGENRADAFSAVTDFYTHESTRGSGKNVARQMFSSDFGMGRAAKSDFWNVIRNDKSVASYTSSGKKALALL